MEMSVLMSDGEKNQSEEGDALPQREYVKPQLKVVPMGEAMSSPTPLNVYA